MECSPVLPLFLNTLLRFLSYPCFIRVHPWLALSLLPYQWLNLFSSAANPLSCDEVDRHNSRNRTPPEALSMGLRDWVSGQFIDIIEWTEPSQNEILSYRFTRHKNEIKNGAK